MKVEIFCICDFAQPGEKGKLNILGIYDTLFVENVPARHGLFAIAIKLRLPNTEAGRKTIKFTFLDPEKKPVLTAVEAVMDIQPVSGALHSNVQIISLIPQLQFLSFGEHSIVLEIDGQWAASTPLFVIQTPQPDSHLQRPSQKA